MSDPNRTTTIEAFNRDGKVLVLGVFGQDVGLDATRQIRLAVEAVVSRKQDYVTLVLDALGHDPLALQRFIGSMHLLRPSADFHYVGYVMTHAAGNAFDLLQHCDWRVAHPGSNLRIDYQLVQLANHDLAQLHEAPDRALRYQRARMAEFFQLHSRRSGLPVEQVQQLCLTCPEMTPQQALEFGFIDEIVETMPAASHRPDYLLRTDVDWERLR